MDPQQLGQFQALMTASVRETMAVQKEQQVNFLAAAQANAQAAAAANVTVAQCAEHDRNPSAHQVLSIKNFSRITQFEAEESRVRRFRIPVQAGCEDHERSCLRCVGNHRR